MTCYVRSDINMYPEHIPLYAHGQVELYAELVAQLVRPQVLPAVGSFLALLGESP